MPQRTGGSARQERQRQTDQGRFAADLQRLRRAKPQQRPTARQRSGKRQQPQQRMHERQHRRQAKQQTADCQRADRTIFRNLVLETGDAALAGWIWGRHGKGGIYVEFVNATDSWKPHSRLTALRSRLLARANLVNGRRAWNNSQLASSYRGTPSAPPCSSSFMPPTFISTAN